MTEGMEEKKVIVDIRHVNKVYQGDNAVVKDLDLQVYEGEFLTLLGSSGCGKTTTLRMIAGFESITSGSILVEGEDVENKEPYERNVNTVFQTYALFPHMTVFDNVAYGLRIKKVPKEEVKKRVTEMLGLVQLGGFEKRFPSQLSGGQKQRVAIAGVIAMEPKCVVLDEPTAMLDPIGRKEVLNTVRALRHRKNVTVILITHYMEEVIYADKIFVMDHGKVVMNGTPKEIFSQVDMLKHYRLDVPQVTMLADELRKKGLDIPAGILKKEELVEALCQLN